MDRQKVRSRSYQRRMASELTTSHATSSLMTQLPQSHLATASVTLGDDEGSGGDVGSGQAPLSASYACSRERTFGRWQAPDDINDARILNGTCSRRRHVH